MLKKRLIPKLLIKHRDLGGLVLPVLVTTVGYSGVRDVGDPVSQAKIYEANLADELIVLNIDGAPIHGDQLMLDLIERLASETLMPLAVGGGVRSIDDFDALLKHGADKVTINGAALAEPGLITEAANRFGAQCVVVSIDYRRDADGAPKVFSGLTGQTDLTPVEWAKRAVNLGAGELVLTDADRDGRGEGLDIAVCRRVAESVIVPVIVSGGCGLAAHFVEGFEEGMAEGVAAGTFFSFRDQSPMQARAHIRNAGVPIRLEV